MRSASSTIAATLLFGAAAPALAVSDGNYSPAKQHCAGSDNNSDRPRYANPSCHNLIFSISDGGGHEYFGFGTYQTPEGVPPPYLDLSPLPLSLNAHAGSFWFDDGSRGCQMFYVDTPLAGSGSPPPIDRGPNAGVDAAGLSDPTKYRVEGPIACDFANPPAEPTPRSLHLYFGADDNLDAGEHDSSDFVNNGPSDGGAIQLNLEPKSLSDWIARAENHDIPGLLTHPAPLADAGGGACADGFCLSAQSTRREEAYDPGTSGARPNGGSVADYSGRQWDPEGCDGPHDGPRYCSDATHPNYTVADWDRVNGDPGVDPGFQFYEDPDAQDSPLVFDPLMPFPKPAIYVGTCGIILGGGAKGSLYRLPPSAHPPAGPAYVNDAGQLVIPTDCHDELAVH